MKDLTIATFISNNEKCNKDFFKFVEEIKENKKVEIIVFCDKKIDINNAEIKQVVGKGITKYRRIIELIQISKSNNILCIDNDITINYKSLIEFIDEFIKKDYDIGWGKIKIREVKKFIPNLIRIDKNLSHDFIRPFLWNTNIGISVPGQVFMLKRDSFLNKLPKIDTVYDDLTIGMIARKNKFKFLYSKLILGSETPKINFGELLKQRIRWSKGMAQSMDNGIKNNMLRYVVIHAFMYHLLWIPYYLLLAIIGKYSMIMSSIFFILTSLCLAELNIKDVFWAICYMLIFPIIHSIWCIYFIYNLIILKIKSG